MSRRNVTNDRNVLPEKKAGTTRKSASSAKPARAAAGSVYVVSDKKSKSEIKAEQRRREDEERRIENKVREQYGEQKTPRMKTLRIIWWITLILAVVFTAAAWFARNFMPDWASVASMVLAYVFIVAALVVDLVFIRKERKRVEEQMAASVKKKGGKNKIYSEARKQVRAEIREEQRAAKEKAKQEGASAEGETKSSFLSKLTGK